MLTNCLSSNAPNIVVINSSDKHPNCARKRLRESDEKINKSAKKLCQREGENAQGISEKKWDVNAYLVDLPEEILIFIFSQLGLATWKMLCNTNKKFYNICLNSQVKASLLNRGLIPSHDELFLKFSKNSDFFLTQLEFRFEDHGSYIGEQNIIDIFKNSPNLKSVNIDYGIEDSDTMYILKHLEQCSALQDLGIYYLESIEQVNYLKKLTSLQSLDLCRIDYEKIGDATKGDLNEIVITLNQLPVLKSLILRENAIDLIQWPFGEPMDSKKIQSLSLIKDEDEDIKDSCLLNRYSSLTCLNLIDIKIEITTRPFFEALVVLQSLTLIKCKFYKAIKTEEGDTEYREGCQFLQSIEKCPLLVLNVLNMKIANDDLENLAKLTHLQSLELNLRNKKKISDEEMKYLTPLSNLQFLRLVNCMINDQGLKHLAPLSKLYSLFLHDCSEVTDNGLQHLHSLPHLELLDIVKINPMND